MQAAEIMSSEPVTGHSDMRLLDAMRLMWDHDIRHLPIVKDGELLGILSDRDIQTGMWMFAENKGDAAMQQLVTPLINSEVLHVEADDDIKKVIAILVEARIGAVPVVETGSSKLVGIISTIDVLRASAERW